MAEPPYGVIWNRLRSGKVVPFLGAGASLAARPPDDTWDPVRAASLPRGRELAEVLGHEASFPAADADDYDDLAKVCSYYVDVAGRPELRMRLREILNHTYPVGRLHRLLAAVPAPLTIFTTNYDDLVERAFQEAGRPYDLVIYPTDRRDLANAILWWPHGAQEPVARVPNELDIDLGTTTVVFKMHGTLVRQDEDWDSYVITEEDYVEFLSRMTANAAVPSLFYQHLVGRSFLFLGYSLRDWNLRVVMRNLDKRRRARQAADPDGEEGAAPSWAIQYRPSELERRLWDRRGVHIFDVTLEELVARLEERRGAQRVGV